jgi:glyoxylase-like metal-dependent hydrolase (beta-lactamase superfamily II)
MEPDPAVTWFICPNPGPLTLDGTCCYAVGRERVVLVDPGPAIPGQIERLEALVRGRPVEAICLTHAHADHSGMAGLAGARFTAPVAASTETLTRLELAGRALDDGDAVPVDGGESALRAIRTPGHSADHMAYMLEPERAVFTGDLVLGAGSSAILHPDGDVGACLASFRRVLSLRPGRLYPGHGPSVDQGEALLKQYADHRIERHAQVGRAIHSGARTVEEVRQRVYGALQAELQGAADASIRAHLTYMREQGERVPAIDGLDEASPIPEES